MTTVEIYVHAEVLQVRARLVPASATSHLETLILRAIAGGVADLDDLADMFGISARLTLDVVGDLWREGRLAIDMGDVREALRVTSKAIEELEHLDEATSLPSSYGVVDAEPIVLDKLTGRLLPQRGSLYRPPEASLVVDLSPEDPTPADLTQQAIDDTVALSLRDRNRGTDDRMDSYRVVGTTLSPSKSETFHRYLPYLVDISLAAGGELSIAVTDERLSLSERELATRRLSGAVHAIPRPPYVQRLQGMVSGGLYKPRGLDELRDEFDRAVDGLRDCAPANRQSRHDQLVAAANQIFHLVEARAQQQMSVELLQTDGQHVAVVHSLIREATRQLIITVPWITERGIRPYLDDLEAALDRGVRIILLWGIRNKDEALPDPVVRHLIALQRHAADNQSAGRLFYPPVPSHLHAKVVVADDRAALITSRNFFSGSNHKEVGVRLDALPDHSCPVTEGILRWAHTLAPSQTVADQIAINAATLGTEKAPLRLSPLPLPRFSGALPEASADSADIRLWLAGWQATRDLLLNLLLAPAQPIVSLVTDGYHRALALEALGSAKRRVVITSDGFSADVVTSGMVTQAREATLRGAAVTMVYGAGRQKGAEARIDDLKEPQPESHPPVVRALHDWHGKVLVFDDSAVVGSYNYLSRDSTKSRGRSTGELSVRIDDPSVADRLAAALQREDQINPRRKSPRQASSPLAAEANVAAQDFLEWLASSASDANHARSLLNTHSPETVLEILRRDAPAACERALAALVATEPSGASWIRWADELVQRTWARGAWWMAATIGRCLPDTASTRDSASLFEATLAILAGAATTPPNLTVDQRDAVALLTVQRLLSTGVMDLYAPLSEWAADCTPDVAQIVSLTKSGINQYGFLGDRLGRQAANRAATGRSEQSWRVLDHAVSELRRYKPKTPPGNQLLTHLFAAGGEMHELETIIATRDITPLRSWMERFDDQDSHWVTRASKRAGLQKPIQDSQKNSFIKKHDALWRAVHATLAESGTAVGDSQADDFQEFENRLANLVDQVAPREGLSGQLITRVCSTLVARIRGAEIPDIPGAVREDWRFPTLLLEEWASDVADDDRVARAVATDALAQWTVCDAVGSIINGGEFELAESLLSMDNTRAHLTTIQADRLEADLWDARQDFRARVSDAIEELRARADCAGVALPEGGLRLTLDGNIARRADVELELATWREHVEASIREATRQTEQELTERLALLNSSEAAIIRDLIGSGDLVAARSLADDPEQLVSSTLEPRSRLWPQRHLSLTQVLFHLQDEARGAPTLREFVPRPSDRSGLDFVESLVELETYQYRNTSEDRNSAEDRDRAAVWTYIDALEGLISTRSRKRGPGRAADDTQPEALMTELAVAHPESLPPFVWQDCTIPVAVGDHDVPGTLFRISLRVAGSRDEPGVVDIAKVLSLLAPVSGDLDLTEVRATRFLRLICPHLSLKDLVDVRALGDLDKWQNRAKLWALMDILGFTVPDSEKASLLGVAGHHPHLMWHLIDTALRERQEAPDVLKSATWDTGRLISRPDFDDLVVSSVQDDLTDLFELATLFTIALWAGDDDISERDLGEALHEAGILLPGEVQLAATLDGLAARRYVDTPTPGVYRMPNTPLGRALTRNDPEGLLAAITQRLLTASGTEEHVPPH